MFAPGIFVVLASSYLTASYYLGDRQKNNALYDEYTALRYYKTAALGYSINGVGIFILFSIQDWSNWNFELANNMIYQIAAFAWLIFGMLLVWFSVGDYKESKSG
jgi:predicted membrane channel-forming protein YqfA (hemolysin III family)